MITIQYFYTIYILVMMFSLYMLIFSIKNKKKELCNKYILISVIMIACLFILYYIPKIFSISLELDILLYYFFSVISGIIYLISIVILNKKKDKLKKSKTSTKTYKIILTTICTLIFILFGFIFNEVHLIKNSTEIVEYNYSTDIGLDLSIYSYMITINEKGCNHVKVGTLYTKNFIEKHINKPYTHISLENEESPLNSLYTIDAWNAENTHIYIYKEDKLICKIKKNNIDNRNINFTGIFSIDK